MEYCLLSAWDCTVYRNQPRARVFLNDVLIDEYNIPNNNHKFNDYYTQHLQDTRSNYHILRPEPNKKINFTFHGIAYKTLLQKTFCKIYKISLPSTPELKLAIDIENDDNDYRNGFLKNCTLLSYIEQIFVPIDKNILETILEKYKSSIILDLARNYKNNVRAYQGFDYFQAKKKHNFSEFFLQHDPTAMRRKIGHSGSFVTHYYKNNDNFLSRKDMDHLPSAWILPHFISCINSFVN